MKLCSSQKEHILFAIKHEKDILKQLTDVPNVTKLANVSNEYANDENCIFFPIYRPFKYETNDQRLILKTIEPLISVLRTIHSRNIYHRDIRPDNILLGEQDNVVLADWGFSVYNSSPQDHFAGTALFCAEEYAKSWVEYTPIRYTDRFDCESLLKCCYFMLRSKVRSKFDILNKAQKLQSAMDIWKEIADNDTQFSHYLQQVAQNTDPYQVLYDFVNSYMPNDDNLQYDYD
ncbi:hypothetical protein FDP41_001600 [Naegleria fowleri]|uniref:Protein kinase domain-containing protein n=1 Tax=Naegleria fowleri TaxID=5763 RepID=A0A6A5BQ78_NAEFO|nr:uncharacterized protein FDP41_001600 [Naegleria fowleri]KAF0979257.1 hypothetical protein FDP41_001600 [Naegleria fowleri]